MYNYFYLDNTWSCQQSIYIQNPDVQSTNLQYSGRRYHLLNIIDELNCELLNAEVETSLPVVRAIKALENIYEWRGNTIVIPGGQQTEDHLLLTLAMASDPRSLSV